MQLTGEEHFAALQAYERAGSMRDLWSVANALRGLNIAIASDDLARHIEPLVGAWEEGTQMGFELFKSVVLVCKTWHAEEAGVKDTSDETMWRADEDKAMLTLNSVGLRDWGRAEIEGIFSTPERDAAVPEEEMFLRLLELDMAEGVGAVSDQALPRPQSAAPAPEETPQARGLNANLLSKLRPGFARPKTSPAGGPRSAAAAPAEDGKPALRTTPRQSMASLQPHRAASRGSRPRVDSIMSDRTRHSRSPSSAKHSHLDDGAATDVLAGSFTSLSALDGRRASAATPPAGGGLDPAARPESASTGTADPTAPPRRPSTASNLPPVSEITGKRARSPYRKSGGHRPARRGRDPSPLVWTEHDAGVQLSAKGSTAVLLPPPAGGDASDAGGQCMGACFSAELTWGIGLQCGDAHDVRVGVCDEDGGACVVYHSYRLGSACGEGRVIVREAPVRVVPVLQDGDVLGFCANARTRELVIQLNGTVVFAASSLGLQQWRPYGEILQPHVALEMLEPMQAVKRPATAAPTVGAAPRLVSGLRKRKAPGGDVEAASRDLVLLRAKAEEVEVMQEDLIASRARGGAALGGAVRNGGAREVALVDPFNHSADTEEMLSWWTRSHGVVKASSLRQTLRYCNQLDIVAADSSAAHPPPSPPAALRLASLQSSLPAARRRLLRRRAELGSAGPAHSSHPLKCPYTHPPAAPATSPSPLDSRTHYMKF